LEDKKPLISVVINCFNGESYLKEAIESVYSQTYQNWEIIFWDNQSTDNSSKIIKSYSKKIKYFYSQNHTSLGEARNLALQKTNGDWIAFLDVDDVWLHTKLEKQVNIINKDNENIGFIYGKCKIINEKPRKNNFSPKKFLDLPEGNIFSSLAIDNYVPLVSALINRKKLAEIGGFPKNLNYAEDYHIFLHMSHKYKVRALQEICCFYRVHENNLSHSHQVHGVMETIEIINFFYNEPVFKQALKSKYLKLNLIYLKQKKFIKSFEIMFRHKLAIIVLKKIILMFLMKLKRIISIIFNY